jgi:glycosyltransferase involved in cell wall biosynthesis
MPRKPELSVILTTYERPAHLERSLASLALQRGVTGQFEVVVADDGSRDGTHNVVRRFACTVDFPVKLTSHSHHGFRVALCRNDGVRASDAPYLLFTDSDCIFPPDHLGQHLRARKPGTVRAGDCDRLDQQATEKLGLAAIESGAYQRWVSAGERRRMLQRLIKDPCYQLIGHRAKPKLTGCNIGISRRDLETVNGFDESFVGWGCEDDDLAFRLRKSGMQIVSVLHYTSAYHMWHPTHPTRPGKWTDGPNVARLQDLERPNRCNAGLIQLFDEPDCIPFERGAGTSLHVARQSRRAA